MIPASNYVIIKNKQFVKWAHGENAIVSDLSMTELVDIEKILEQAVGYDLTKDFSKQGYFKVFLPDYGRQYVPTINNKGEKIVWINLFCDKMTSIPTDKLVLVMDGGKCYFRITVNLDKKTYYSLAFNGFA